MLNEREIYAIGKAAVDEIRDNYYRRMGTDIISKHPEKFISCLDDMIAALERVKGFAVDYQKAREE